MIANADFLEYLRRIVNQEASIPALRVTLFSLGALAAMAWDRRRPFLALSILSTGGLAGLSYWLVQIVSPLGFETNPAATRDWAQAGVNAWAEPGGAGFVLGTPPSLSLVAALAAAGVPMAALVLVPAVACLLTMSLLILVPVVFLRNRTTAALAACLALGGGLWPGMAPYGAILLHPSSVALAFSLSGILVLTARGWGLRRSSKHVRFGVAAGFIAAATADRSVQGGAEPSAMAALLLCGAGILLASPIRLALRAIASPRLPARSAEALILLCVFGGSGLFWWDPPKSVPGFNQARNQNLAFLRPMEWIRRNVPATSAVLASPAYSASIAAIAGRRVLFWPPGGSPAEASLPQPFRRARLAESARLGWPLARLADSFFVTHLFLGPGEPTPEAATNAFVGSEPRMVLVPVYEDDEDFRVFRFVKK